MPGNVFWYGESKYLIRIAIFPMGMALFNVLLLEEVVVAHAYIYPENWFGGVERGIQGFQIRI
jgi:hypothetical protein